MLDFALALPVEICQALGKRCRARRLLLNLSVSDLAGRVGISDRTLGSFERSGRCTLETFVRVLEALNALPDLAGVLVSESRSIHAMRQKSAAVERKRAYPLQRKGAE
jgi:transcriptional regulator with XRE-family HTH domain